MRTFTKYLAMALFASGPALMSVAVPTAGTLAVAALSAEPAMAQSAGQVRRQQRAVRRAVRKQQRAVRRNLRQQQRAQRRVLRAERRADRREARHARQDARRDRRRARQDQRRERRRNRGTIVAR